MTQELYAMNGQYFGVIMCAQSSDLGYPIPAVLSIYHVIRREEVHRGVYDTDAQAQTAFEQLTAEYIKRQTIAEDHRHANLAS